MPETDALGEVFRALADPTRRALFERLADTEEATVGTLTDGAGISQPAVSQHLGVLRKAGLVAERRAGRNTHYRVDPQGLGPLVGWIGHYTAFWRSRVARLETLLREMDQ